MSLSSDRAEMLSRLRSSNDRDAVLCAANTFKLLASLIVLQTSRSNVVIEDCLDATIACATRFSDDEEVNETLLQAVYILTTAKKEFAQAVHSSGFVTLIIVAVKSFPRNLALNVAAVRTLSELSAVDKRAPVVIRLQGGVVYAVQLLNPSMLQGDANLIRHAFDFLSLMIRRSPASAAIIAKIGGVDCIAQAGRRHLPNARVFQSMVALLDRLCLVESVIGRVANTHGLVPLILDALGQANYLFKTFTVIMRVLKNIARPKAGARAINEAGGFDSVLALIEHHFSKPSAVRLACSLLWQLQRHDFHEVVADEKLYHMQKNFLRVYLPQGDPKSDDDGDGYASDDSCLDRDADEDAGEVKPSETSPLRQSSIPSSTVGWNRIQFMPELWPAKNPTTIEFNERNAREIRSAVRARSLRSLLPHPTCMNMCRASGLPGNDNPSVEHQHLPQHSKILANMLAASDRFETGREFKGHVVYDRNLHDGDTVVLAASRTQPRSWYGPTTIRTSDGNEEDVDDLIEAPQQDKLVETRHNYDRPGFYSNPELIPPLTFESRFESGNLFRAIIVGKLEYDLIVSSDLNSAGRTQWFLFRIENMRADIVYKFNIINMEKPDSAFNRGMRPVMYSNMAAARGDRNWFRAEATDIAYFQNYFKRPHGRLSKRSRLNKDADEEREYYHTLTFTLTFPYSNDSVYLAYFYPFTFTFQRQCLSFLELSTFKSPVLRRQVLCYSLGGNPVDLLTITNFKSSMLRIEQRPVVVLTARIHPGETNSSWVMKGALELLTGVSDIAQYLRDNLVFKVIPMLNPDGVIEGNYRCSVTGQDQNRQWIDPSETSSPVVFNAKRLIVELAETRQLLMLCDFHGHSVASNFMMYGNDEAECIPSLRPMARAAAQDKTPTPAWMATVGADFAQKERLFPVILSRRAPNLFSADQSCFNVQKSRAGTARVVFWRELPLPFCFTMEATFNGSTFGSLKGLLYNTDHYETIGQEFCRAIGDLIAPDQELVSRAAIQLSSTGSNSHNSFPKKRIPARKNADRLCTKGKSFGKLK